MADLNLFIDDDVDGVMPLPLPLPLPHISFSLILTFSTEKQQPIAAVRRQKWTNTFLQSTPTRISCTIDLNNLHVCIDGSRNECIFLSIQTWCDQQLHIWRVIRVRTRFFGLLNDCFMVVALNRHKNYIRYTYIFMPFSVFIVQLASIAHAARFRRCFFASFFVVAFLSLCIFNWPPSASDVMSFDVWTIGHRWCNPLPRIGTGSRHTLNERNENISRTSWTRYDIRASAFKVAYT